MKKLLVLVAGGIGYVLGARAGRGRYDQIMQALGKVRDDPRVQEKAQQASEYAKEQAPVVKDKAAKAASAAGDKVTPGSGSGAGASGATGGSQESPFPQSDLP